MTVDLSVGAVRDRFRGKTLKYASVSAVGVVTSVTLLVFTLEVLEWSPLVANLVAVSVSSVPAYLLNRAWVWGKTSRHSFSREVLPFWAMAVVGLVWSTLVVWVVQTWTDNSVLLVLANLAAFGSLWVAKFLILDEVLFHSRHHDHGHDEDDHLSSPA